MSIYKRLKNHFDIVDIASRYLDVEQRGTNFFAKCFHGEKTASLSISPYKKIFTCFGCGIHGDIIDLVMYGEGCTHHQAVKLLADEAGIEYSTSSGNNKTREALQLMQDFTHMLAVNTSDGDLLHYITLSRVRHYKIGILLPHRDIHSLLLEKELPLPVELPDECLLLPIFDSRGIQGFVFYNIEDLTLLGWYLYKPVLFYADNIVLAKIKFHLNCTITDNPILVALNASDNLIAVVGDITQDHIDRLKSFGLLKIQINVSNPMYFIEKLHRDFSVDVITEHGEVLGYLSYIQQNHPDKLDDYLRGSEILKKYYKKEN